jgi:hypothetical protein
VIVVGPWALKFAGGERGHRLWSRVGPALLCTECGVPGAVNIVPNWHDRIGHALPFSRKWKRDEEGTQGLDGRHERALD